MIWNIMQGVFEVLLIWIMLLSCFTMLNRFMFIIHFSKKAIVFEEIFEDKKLSAACLFLAVGLYYFFIR